MKKTVIALFLAAGIIFTIPVNTNAQGDYEFYFFGINLKSFQESNWVKVTAGAVASVLVHELGHALYLQSQGKDWDLQSSSSSGLAIHTSETLSENQYRNFGRAGFALQTFIGAVLTTFDNTRYSDFTKGWVGMNAFQVCSYNGRNHDIGNDFEMIERGGGNGDFELGVFYLIGSHNLLKMDMPAQMPYFSSTIKAKALPESFYTWEKQPDQFMLSSSDKPASFENERLIFSRNIDKMWPDKNEKLFLTSFRKQATYDN
ncbi:MAG: hypothetical protein JRF60_02740 [Deltaproteobacteria bacterium]|nr:hypothetical protein [Deltaproteobacteria bacterium]